MTMTYVEALDVAINLADGAVDAEVVEKLTALKAQLSKKHSSASNDKKRAESDARAEQVYAALAEMDEPVTASDLVSLTSNEEVSNYSVPRVAALLRKLGDRVVKEQKGKKTYYSVA